VKGDVKLAIARAVGRGVASMGPLAGGCVGEVYRARLDDGEDVVVKVDSSAAPSLDIEGYMLRYLGENSALPVPAVLHSDPALLVMEFLPGSSNFDRSSEMHAAELLAELHGVSSGAFGLERDTLIGSLHQPNTQSDSWVAFFQEHRLLAMGRQAVGAGRMNTRTLKRIEALAAKCDELLEDPAQDSLLHGDVWSANVLAEGGRITGFVDPAMYYGHAEIELAFITLFSTFGEAFFARYRELRALAAGFFEVRRDIYNVYPLLVHVRLFGGGYLSGVERVLARHGC
jgi:fructosamine-3-kinase